MKRIKGNNYSPTGVILNPTSVIHDLGLTRHSTTKSDWEPLPSNSLTSDRQDDQRNWEWPFELQPTWNIQRNKYMLHTLH